MKRCTTCQVVQPRENFWRNKATSDGLHSQCKDCNRAQKNKWRADNPEKWRAQQRRWRGWSYGLSPADLVELEATQGGRCAICGDEAADEMHIDHCHNTGAVRGLLCRACNHGLGNFRDDPELLKAAIAYLTR